MLQQILLLIAAANSHALDAKLNFVINFFENEEVAINIESCWSNRDKLVILNTIKYKKIGFSVPYTPDTHLLDLIGCAQSREALQLLNQSDGFKYPSRHLILIDKFDLDELLTELANYTISVTSNIIIVEFQIGRNEAKIFQAYRVHYSGPIIYEDYGTWDQINGIVKTKQPPMLSRRRNMFGVHFKVNYLFEDNSTHQYIDTFKNPTIDTLAKQNYGSFRCLMDLCNITHKFVIAEKYGYLNKTTGKFDGIIGSLYTKETLFSASSLLFTKERLQYVDYIKEMNPQEIKILFKKPSLSSVTGIFYIAFHKYVWGSMFLLLILFSMTVYFIGGVHKPQNVKLTTSDAILVSLEAVCQQGTTMDPKSISGRILLFLSFLSFMLMFVAYSGNIVVLLQATRPFNNLEDFLNSPIEAGTMETSYMRFYMSSINDPIRQQIYKNKIGIKGYHAMEYGLNKVKNDFYAFHMETTPAYHYMQKTFTDEEICSVQKLDGYIPTNLGYMPMQKGSPYKKILKVAMMKIAEHGLHQRHFNRFLAQPKCYSSFVTFKSVGLVDAYQAFVIYIGFSVFAVFIFVAEIAYKKIR